MTMNILALIDNACEDWETSEDAMRWTPEPPATGGNLMAQIQAFAARVMAAELTDWQREVLANAWMAEFPAYARPTPPAG